MTSSTTAPPAMPACDHTPRPWTGPSRDDVLAARRTYERIGFVDCLEYEEVILRP